MRLYLRLAGDEAGVDAAAMPELREWLVSRSPVPLDEPPAWVGEPTGAGEPAGRMNVLQTVLEVMVDATAVGQLLVAIAKWRKADRRPAVTVSTDPASGGYRVESTDPRAVADVVRALHGS